MGPTSPNQDDGKIVIKWAHFIEITLDDPNNKQLITIKCGCL